MLYPKYVVECKKCRSDIAFTIKYLNRCNYHPVNVATHFKYIIPYGRCLGFYFGGTGVWNTVFAP